MFYFTNILAAEAYQQLHYSERKRGKITKHTLTHANNNFLQNFAGNVLVFREGNDFEKFVG